MKKHFLLTFAVSLLWVGTAIFAQKSQVVASKKYITKKVDVENFAHLTVLGSPDVFYTQIDSKKPRVEVYGSDNIVDLLDITVEHNTLIVKFKKNTSIRNCGKLEVKVSGPALESMKVEGSGDIHLVNGINTSKLNLNVSGSGDIAGNKISCSHLVVGVKGSGDIKLQNIQTELVEASVAGSGDIVLAGNSVNANLQVQGSGDIKAKDLKSENVTAKLSGSGDISCYAVRTLKGSIGGSGTVAYKGSPEISLTSKKGLKKL